MKNLPIYCFEGTANIVCEKCKRKHTLIFSGGDGETIPQAIQDALDLDDWKTDPILCPDCYEEYDGEPIIDEDEEDFEDDFDGDMD